MKAEIKSIYSTDIDDLAGYRPPNGESFSFFLRIIAGPKAEPGEESFDLQVCTPKWFLDNFGKDEVIIGRHYLIVMEYSFQRIIRTITDYVERCEGSDWHEVGEKLARLGYWEFEDYRPYLTS